MVNNDQLRFESRLSPTSSTSVSSLMLRVKISRKIRKLATESCYIHTYCMDCGPIVHYEFLKGIYGYKTPLLAYQEFSDEVSGDSWDAHNMRFILGLLRLRKQLCAVK